MPHTLTIAGRSFTVEPRYAAGHVLNDNEAATLNQTFYENLRNNFAPKAKEGADQAAFDEYASQYAFGVRTGGGGSRDPIEVEAMELARDAVRKGILASGKKISDYKAAAISEAAAKYLEKKPELRELARKRVEEMRANAETSLGDDILGALDAAQASGDESGEEPEEGQPEDESEGSTEEAAAPARRRRQAEAAA